MAKKPAKKAPAKKTAKKATKTTARRPGQKAATKKLSPQQRAARTQKRRDTIVHKKAAAKADPAPKGMSEWPKGETREQRKQRMAREYCERMNKSHPHLIHYVVDGNMIASRRNPDFNGQVGPYTFCSPQCVCKEHGGENNVIGRLMHLCDLQGVAINELATHESRVKLLRSVGLPGKTEVTEMVASKVKHLSALWDAAFSAYVADWNKKCAPEEVIEDTPEAAVKARTVEPEVAKPRRKKGEPKPVREKVEVVRDRFSCKEGSQGAAINACISKKPITLEKIAEKTSLGLSRVRAHVKFLIAKGFAIEGKKGVQEK